MLFGSIQTNKLQAIIQYFLPLFWHLENLFHRKVIRFIPLEVIQVLFNNPQTCKPQAVLQYLFCICFGNKKIIFHKIIRFTPLGNIKVLFYSILTSCLENFEEICKCENKKYKDTMSMSSAKEKKKKADSINLCPIFIDIKDLTL